MPTPLSIADTQQTRQRVTGAIAGASARTGIDFDYLYNQARIESSLNPAAKATTSSATGLFQFTRQTWLATLKQHGAAHGLAWAANAIRQDENGQFTIEDAMTRQSVFDLRSDPEASSIMAAAFASDNEAFLSRELGRAIEPVDLYLAHFLGAGGAAKFLSAHDADPATVAAPLNPAAAAANRSIFYRSDGSARSVGDIREMFAARLARQPLSDRPADMGSAMTMARSVSVTTMAYGSNLRTIEPMPARLSLDFARAAYQRLAGLDGATG
jgi:hypothetical protein